MYDAHLQGKKHINNVKKMDSAANGSSGNGVAKNDRRMEVAGKELLIRKYIEGLSDVREETKANVERKQALTDKERTVSLIILSNCICVLTVMGTA